jgi:2-C-methyl-D-erythritol 2,4-cyclodiphosphate synthase
MFISYKVGYDFWLGGIKLEHEKGAVGHSDADVLIHVICDALLGAANLRDIGYHFSDKDPKYKGHRQQNPFERGNASTQE